MAEVKMGDITPYILDIRRFILKKQIEIPKTSLSGATSNGVGLPVLPSYEKYDARGNSLGFFNVGDDETCTNNLIDYIITRPDYDFYYNKVNESHSKDLRFGIYDFDQSSYYRYWTRRRSDDATALSSYIIPYMHEYLSEYYKATDDDDPNKNIRENTFNYFFRDKLDPRDHERLHNIYNTKTNNMSYPSFSSSNYDYKGCWSGRFDQALAKNYGPVNDANECYIKAYNGNSKYFGLQQGQCFASNTNEENYKSKNIKGFTDRCQQRFGGRKTNQIYELKYTFADVQQTYNALQNILNKIKEKYNKVTDILNDTMSKDTQIKLLLDDSIAAVKSGDDNLESAKSASYSAFNLSALALQNAETARNLSLDLKKQKDALQTAKIAIQYANDCLSYILTSNNEKLKANMNYNRSITNANSAIILANNISKNITDADMHYQDAIREYRRYSYNLAINAVPSVDIKIVEIETYIGEDALPNSIGDISNTASININFMNIRDTINNKILPNINTIRTYLSRENDFSKIRDIDNILNKSHIGASLVLTNGQNILESTKLELLRIEDLDANIQSQQSQLAEANEEEAKILQAEFDAATAKKAILNLEAANERANKANLEYDRSLVQIETVNKQKKLMNKINANIININNVTTIEGFSNPLPIGSNQEINNYVSLLTNSNVQKQPQVKINESKILKQYNDSVSNVSNVSNINNKNNKNNLNCEYYIVNSVNDCDQSVQLNNNGVNVMPCNMDSSQRFGTNYHTVL